MQIEENVAESAHRWKTAWRISQVLELDGETGWRMIPNRDYLASAAG